jgi:hypothetical protein
MDQSSAVRAIIKAVAKKRSRSTPEQIRLALKAEAHRRKVKYEPTEDDIRRISASS